MSRKRRVIASLFAISVALLATACVAPADRLDEFSQNVIDASSTDAPPGIVADIGGEFHLGLSPLFAPLAVLEFIATVEFTETADGGIANFSFQPLTVSGREPVGAPLISNDVVINSSGEFTGKIAGMVPGAANPISGQNITADLTILGVIRSADLWCGDVDGDVTEPSIIVLDGSTFGAIRIVPGTIGAALTEDPPSACPTTTIDAGVPDAMPPDATIFDAGIDA